MGKNRQDFSRLIQESSAFFSDYIQEHFSKSKLDQLARDKGFVQRKSRLDASRFLDLLIFCDQGLDQLSLEDMANGFCEQHEITISKQAIQERFNNQAVDFMTSLLREVLSSHLDTAQIDKSKYTRFNRVLIKDSTRYTLPESYSEVFKGHGGCGSKAQISIQYEYDLLTNTTKKLELTEACRNDQFDSRETLESIQKGDLLLRDLGYVSQDYLKHVFGQQAYFLNRLNSRWNVYDLENKMIDFSKIVRKLNKNSIPFLEIEVKIASMPMRMVISKVSSQVYEQRIRKAERSAHGRHKVSKEFKMRAWLNIFITNVPKNWIDTHQVCKAYGLRWQVELIFKIWKSQAKIDKMKPMKIQRFQCQLIARMIWLMIHYQALRLVDQSFRQQGLPFRCSPHKFFKIAFRVSQKLRNAVFYYEPLINWVKKLFHKAEKKYPVETKKGKQNVFETINTLLT